MDRKECFYKIDQLFQTRRIRVLHMTAREVESGHFQAIATGLLGRRLEHYYRDADTTTSREVSPQCLVYYRDILGCMN